MIIRSRPKYLTLEMIDAPINDSKGANGEYLYNSGRAALKHFLIEWKAYYKIETPVIAIQAFNCRAVADSALQAGYKIVLLDSNKQDLSISVRQLEELPEKPDVLLLTHYQGIPCVDYQKIAEYCSGNNILLIDDLAQTEGSKVNNIESGALSYASIKSYAFDKPFSLWEGGSININPADNKEFHEYFKESYSKLNSEPYTKASADLKRLKMFMIVTVEKNYFRKMETDSVVKTLIDGGTAGRLFAKIYSNYIRTSRKIRRRITGSDNYIDILKMHSSKEGVLNSQRINFAPDSSEVEALESYIKQSGGNTLTLPETNINWNRYSVLDEGGKLRAQFNYNEIEVSNYNWPVPLHKIFKGNKNIIIHRKPEVSEYLSANILNIPVWSNYFRSKV